MDALSRSFLPLLFVRHHGPPQLFNLTSLAACLLSPKGQMFLCLLGQATEYLGCLDWVGPGLLDSWALIAPQVDLVTGSLSLSSPPPQQLYKTRYFVNNVICSWNLFLVLLTNNSSSIRLEMLKDEVDIIKFITYIREKKKDFNNIKKM